ncbi:hypothetical protein LCGC14_2166970 [marine sediment metagenome]|uniref:Uncharacterized protein n=1 Tax=marine sediment metagenome TaxID=412755 RepID=A0A0F9GM96_9ZZZZ
MGRCTCICGCDLDLMRDGESCLFCAVASYGSVEHGPRGEPEGASPREGASEHQGD